MLKDFFKKIKGFYLDLINTGERPILEKKLEEIIPDHQFAYKFAANYVKNKTILDFGCGGGYGTEFLSRFTLKKATGYDIDRNTIAITNRFFNKKNLCFISDPDKLRKYDVITMFQVIEHFSNSFRNEILKKISKTYLLAEGIFICSTPNKLVTSPGLKKPVMVFHNCEYTPISLNKELKKYFKKVKIYGQTEVLKETKATSKIQLIRKNLTRFLSQIEMIRAVSRHLPIKFKYLLMGNLVKDRRQYKLVTKREKIKDAITLIAICQN